MNSYPATFRKKQMPDASYRIDDIFALAHLVIMRAQDAGCFVLDGHEPSDEEIRVEMDAAELADHIENLLDKCKDEEILPLIDWFDNVFRIGYGEKPDQSYMDRLYRRAFESWRFGNKNIEESSIFAMIAMKMVNPLAKVDEDQAKAYHMILDRWVSTVNEFGRFPGVTSCENYIRLSLMRVHRIKDYYENPGEVRRHWYEKNKVEDLTELSSVILRSYRRFISSMWPDALTYREQLGVDNRILLELSTRQDVNPRDREACRLALRFNQTQLAPS